MHLKSAVVRTCVGFKVWLDFMLPLSQASHVQTIKEIVKHSDKLFCFFGGRISEVRQSVSNTFAQNLSIIVQMHM